VKKFAFGNRETLDRTLEAVRVVEQRSNLGGSGEELSGQIVYMEVTEVVSDTEVKGNQVVWDSSLDPSAFAAPEGDPYIWDSDSTIDRAQPNLQVPSPVAVGDFLEVTYYTDKSNTTYHLARVGGGGSSLIWLTTDNTGLSFEFGARYDRPQGTGTALTVDDTYYIATPWNTRIVAPTNHFGYFVQNGTDWYKTINQFYVKPSMNYPAGAGTGITTFTCYMDKSDTSLDLGTHSAFPSGIKCLSKTFDSANAGTNSLNYWNGKLFEASFDTAANIIYLDHPSF